MVPIKVKLANKANYGSKRKTSLIKYVVIHYTGNDGDTDENNGKYFANNVVKASAHYFVDDDSITQSVPDDCTAYAVGGNRYASHKQTGGAKFYGFCTNANSVSIELCDDVKNGKVYPSAKTIQNALDLARMLMKKYSIPAANVIRHFDVTGKLCPAYWSGTPEKNNRWKTEFWDKLNSTTAEDPVKPAEPEVESMKLNVGDIVNFIGTKHYLSSQSANGSACRPGKARVTALSSTGKHLVHLVAVVGEGSNVHGWVDTADVTRENVTLAVGARVKVNAGAKTYTGGQLSSFVYNNTYDVISIQGNRVVIGQGRAITAAVNKKDLTVV